MLVYFNGQWLNENKAVVSVNNRSFRYGDGCFETMRLVHGRIPLGNLHMDRLFGSMELLGMEPPSWLHAGKLLNEASELADRNGVSNSARVRLTVFRGDGGLTDVVSATPQVLIQCWALDPWSPEPQANGMVAGISQSGHKPTDRLANLKSNSALLYVMAAAEARRQRWNDALILNHRGEVADASIANFWWLSNEVWHTTPLESGPVNGVMRRYLLRNLPGVGIQVSEQVIGVPGLDVVEAAFLSNAVYGIRWIGMLNGRALPPHPDISRIIRHLLQPLWYEPKNGGAVET